LFAARGVPHYRAAWRRAAAALSSRAAPLPSAAAPRRCPQQPQEYHLAVRLPPCRPSGGRIRDETDKISPLGRQSQQAIFRVRGPVWQPPSADARSEHKMPATRSVRQRGDVTCATGRECHEAAGTGVSCGDRDDNARADGEADDRDRPACCGDDYAARAIDSTGTHVQVHPAGGRSQPTAQVPWNHRLRPDSVPGLAKGRQHR
jgi:hypothetical protein